MLNYAVAMKRWPGEPEKSWQKRKRKLDKLKEKIYELASQDDDCPWFEHEPSYEHPEP